MKLSMIGTRASRVLHGALNLGRDFVQWLASPDFLIPIEDCSADMLADMTQEKLPWVSDEKLASLLNACEVEHVNRMAEEAGYLAYDLEMWVPQSHSPLLHRRQKH